MVQRPEPWPGDVEHQGVAHDMERLASVHSDGRRQARMLDEEDAAEGPSGCDM